MRPMDYPSGEPSNHHAFIPRFSGANVRRRRPTDPGDRPANRAGMAEHNLAGPCIRHNRIFCRPAPQLAGSIAAVIILVIIALRLQPISPKISPTSTHPAPGVRFAGAFSLTAGSIFMLIPRPYAWWIPVILYVVLYAVVIIIVGSWSERPDGRWTPAGPGQWSSSHLRLACISGVFYHP
jgi:hypothetical protein